MDSTRQALIIDVVKDVLAEDERVVFAHLYGSFPQGERYEDLDIAIYSLPGVEPFALSADIKVALHEKTGISPDFFDVRVINGLLDHGDLFSLLYLKRVFESDQLLVDKDFDTRTDFLQRYGIKYRECEGLIDEVLL